MYKVEVCMEERDGKVDVCNLSKESRSSEPKNQASSIKIKKTWTPRNSQQLLNSHSIKRDSELHEVCDFSGAVQYELRCDAKRKRL